MQGNAKVVSRTAPTGYRETAEVTMLAAISGQSLDHCGGIV
jgi:hypothetical protein